MIVLPQTEEAAREAALIPPAVSCDVMLTEESFVGAILVYDLWSVTCILLVHYITRKALEVETHHRLEPGSGIVRALERFCLLVPCISAHVCPF